MSPLKVGKLFKVQAEWYSAEGVPNLTPDLINVSVIPFVACSLVESKYKDYLITTSSFEGTETVNLYGLCP